MDPDLNPDETPSATPPACAVKHEEILEALRDRADWETKLERFDRMRHEGLRRARKPWTGAADMHFPLADMQVEKLKPFYTQQVYAGELIAAFSAAKAGAQAVAGVAAQWFDYQVKQRSNFEEVLPVVVDRMCQNGRAVVRVLWDAQRRRLRFECPRPWDIIVPAATKTLREADWIVLVQTWSVHAYRRARVFTTDEGVLARIRGGSKEADTAATRDNQYRRAGITFSNNKNEIVVWVVHEREGDGWRVRTYSPADPQTELRSSFLLPFHLGPFRDGAPPFAAFSFEAKDEELLAARGVCEKVEPFEAALNSDWNAIKDNQQLTTIPVFSAPGLKNAANVRLTPGAVLPFEIRRVEHPPLSPEVRQGMAETRQVAEQMVGVPDFGTGGFKQPGGKKTAAEVNMIGGVMGQTVELRARVFRRELGELLALAWAVLCQYAQADRDYRYRDELATLPDGVFADPEAFAIEPSASGDTFSREQKVQKAQARLQMFANDPFINQAELRKDYLECDTPGLVKRLFVDPQFAAANAMEDQAQELSVLTMGFPAAVHPADDHAAHLRCLFLYLQRRGIKREPLTPELALLLAQHAGAHLSALQQTNRAAAAEFAEPMASLGRIAAAAQQALGASPTTLPGAPAPMNPQPTVPDAL